jgi:hypothetical protein
MDLEGLFANPGNDSNVHTTLSIPNGMASAVHVELDINL